MSQADLPLPVRQPGAPSAERVSVVPARAARFRFAIPAGQTLLEGVQAGFASAGFASGIAILPAMRLHPFRYVMPALAEDEAHAAFYSAVFEPAAPVMIETGALTFGTRAGAPFFHAHALWQEPERGLSGGHILPDGTRVRAPVTLDAIGLDGAAFVAEPDDEINFTVFGPKPAPANGRGTHAARAMRLHPNVDPFAVLEAAGAGLGPAAILGGVGSTIGARFADGRVIDTLASEIFLREGAITEGLARLDIGFVDHQGHIHRGPLARGRNRVLMTMELVLMAFA